MASKQAKKKSPAKSKGRSKNVKLSDLKPRMAAGVKGGDTNTTKTTSTDTQTFYKVTMKDILISG